MPKRRDGSRLSYQSQARMKEKMFLNVFDIGQAVYGW
jgi:hypothetical protein